MLETLDYTIRIGSIPTFLYFDLYLYSAYAAYFVYFLKVSYFLWFYIWSELNFIDSWLQSQGNILSLNLVCRKFSVAFSLSRRKYKTKMQKSSPIEEDICCEDRTHAQFSTDYPRGVETSTFPSFNIENGIGRKVCSSVWKVLSNGRRWSSLQK